MKSKDPVVIKAFADLKALIKEHKALKRAKDKLETQNYNLKNAIGCHATAIESASHDKHKVHADKKLWKHVGRHK